MKIVYDLGSSVCLYASPYCNSRKYPRIGTKSYYVIKGHTSNFSNKNGMRNSYNFLIETHKGIRINYSVWVSNSLFRFGIKFIKFNFNVAFRISVIYHSTMCSFIFIFCFLVQFKAYTHWALAKHPKVWGPSICRQGLKKITVEVHNLHSFIFYYSRILKFYVYILSYNRFLTEENLSLKVLSRKTIKTVKFHNNF